MANRSRLPDIWRSERGVSPFRELSRLQNRIDRMFEDFFSEPVFSVRPLREYLSSDEFAPACDVEETDKHYLVSFDLPGVKKEDVKIEVRDNALMVSGERKQEHKEKEKGTLSQERYYGSFMRSFTLPSNVDADKVEASYENGVLQVALPKTVAAVGKQIPIKEGKLLEEKKEKAA